MVTYMALAKGVRGERSVRGVMEERQSGARTLGTEAGEEVISRALALFEPVDAGAEDCTVGGLVMKSIQLGLKIGEKLMMRRSTGVKMTCGCEVSDLAFQRALAELALF